MHISWRAIWNQCCEFWTTDHSLTVLFGLLVLLLFVVTPLVSGAVVRSELETAFFSLLAMTGVASVARKPVVVAAVGIYAALSISLDWFAHFSTSGPLQLLDVGLRVRFRGVARFACHGAGVPSGACNAPSRPRRTGRVPARRSRVGVWLRDGGDSQSKRVRAAGHE